MLDRQARTIDYIRISVTDRCNLRCVYCMPEEGIEWVPHAEILSYEDIVRLCRVFARLGLCKVKLTGGEPLVRPGLSTLIHEIKCIEGMKNVTLTTNGVLLEEQLPALMDAGLDGLNISLDTLDREQFKTIARRDALDTVLRGLDMALAQPTLNVKLNCLPMGKNDDQLVPLAALAKDKPLAVRFIELMPIGKGKDLNYRSETEIRAMLESVFGQMTPYDRPLGNGPCHYFSLPDFTGKVGFISAISHQFCDRCNRVRMTADGYLKTCLQYDNGISLKALIQAGESDDVILKAIENTIFAKPLRHHFTDSQNENDLEQHIMSQIGG